MPAYTFRCPSCLKETDRYTRGEPVCLRCEVPMRRVWGFNLAHSMPAHYNQSTGQFVTNERAFKDQLKEMGERQSESTGLYHDYQPVDITDRKACGVTDDGLESTRKVNRDSGSVGPEKGRKVIA